MTAPLFMMQHVSSTYRFHNRGLTGADSMYMLQRVYTTEPFQNGSQRTVMDRSRTVLDPVYTICKEQVQTDPNRSVNACVPVLINNHNFSENTPPVGKAHLLN